MLLRVTKSFVNNQHDTIEIIWLFYRLISLPIFAALCSMCGQSGRKRKLNQVRLRSEMSTRELQIVARV